MLSLAGCTTDFALGPPYLPCAPDGSCRSGCHCLDGKVCVPQDPFAGPEACADPDRIRCQENRDCLAVGCTCRGGYCEPGVPGADPALCQPGEPPFSCVEPGEIILVDSELDGVQAGNATTLRRALEMAAARPGPRRIAFSQTVQEILVNSALPPVPSLCVLDGYNSHEATPVIIQPSSATGAEFDGLTIDGAGIIVLHLRVQGFNGAGVRVRPGSDGVHLYRLDLRENGLGLSVGGPEAKTTRVYLSRLLEIPSGSCLPEEIHDGSEAAALYDVHRVVANRQGGVRIENADDVLIEGAWVGFSNLPADLDGWHNPALGNGGDGILLDGVHRAHLGALHLPEQAAQRLLWDGPSSLAAGRAGEAAIHLVRSGDIRLHGVQVNDTPVFDPYDESGGPGLVIEENDGSVWYGGTAADRDAAGWQLNIVHTETTTGILVRNPGAPVWLRGIQVQCYWGFCNLPALDFVAPQGQVTLAHFSVVGEFRVPPLRASGPGGMSATNCLFKNDLSGSEASDTLVQVEGDVQVAFQSLVRWNLPELCTGFSCGNVTVSKDMIFFNAAPGCFTVNNSAAWPDTPQCPGVDIGQDLGLDLNGIGDGDFVCAPDVGCFECQSTACRAACP